MRSLESAEREKDINGFEQLPVSVFEGQLADLEKQLLESWQLGKMALMVMDDARRMLIGEIKSYKVDWGIFRIGRTVKGFMINVLTNEGDTLVQRKNETGNFKN